MRNGDTRMTVLYDPRKEWAKDETADPMDETLGSLFVKALTRLVEHERVAPFGGRDIDDPAFWGMR